MKDNKWQWQEAKTRLSQLIDDALNGEPQFITKHGNDTVVVVSLKEYKKMIKPEKGLVEFFRESPLLDSELEFTRDSDFRSNKRV